MAPRRQRWLIPLIIVGGFTLSGAMSYWAAHWLMWNDPLYKQIFWSRYQWLLNIPIVIERWGVWYAIATGLFLGVCVAAVHAQRWLLLPVSLLLWGLGVMFLVG
jgi:hypothetical protein